MSPKARLTIWRIYLTAKTTGPTAAEQLNVPTTQPWARYQVNQATNLWGRFVEGKLHETDDQGNLKWTPEQLLNPDEQAGESSSADRRFAGDDELLAFMGGAESW